MKLLFELFYVFFKLGLFTFGGGYAMIPQMKEIVIEKKKWIDESEMLDMIAIAESTPGPIAINLATFIGFKKKGIFGSAIATLGVVLPSLLIIFIISLFFEKFLAITWVKYAFVGIKCAVSILILKAGLNMFKKIKKNPINLTLFLIALTLMLLMEIFSFKISSIYFILVGGAIGIVYYGLIMKEELK